MEPFHIGWFLKLSRQHEIILCIVLLGSSDNRLFGFPYPPLPFSLSQGHSPSTMLRRLVYGSGGRGVRTLSVVLVSHAMAA